MQRVKGWSDMMVLELSVPSKESLLCTGGEIANMLLELGALHERTGSLLTFVEKASGRPGLGRAHSWTSAMAGDGTP